jgi:ATP-binding cassette subfamily C protein
LLVFSRLIPRVNSLYQTYSRVLHLVPIYQDATQMLADCMANQEAKPSQEPVTLTRHIHLQDLGFSYGTTPVLEKVSCTIPINTTTAIVGLSGAGKTTLADLITGLLAPTTGHIICDDTVLTGDRTHAWRRQIGYVAQDPYLFHDTVKQNLLWVKPDATDDQLWKALHMASLGDVVRALPHGLDTIIGDKGVHLSGGERQRLALARALLRTPTVLVLDEATSALDRQNEEAIYTTLKKLHGTITILIIAHRWSTIRDADQVMVLNQNTLAEFGSPSQLFSSSQSLFHHLFSDQQKGVSLGA